MTTPLLALLEYAFAARSGGLRLVRDLALQKARAVRVPEPEDATQSLILKLCASPQRTRAVLDALAARNPGLAMAFESTPAGAVPSLTPEAREHAESQLIAYVARAMRNAATDHFRKEHPQEALPESDRLRDPLTSEEPSELLALRSRVLDAVENDARRPDWLDGTIAALEALATGEQTMDELTARCIAGDASLQALRPEAARTRARNRLQQQHQRARLYLITQISSMVTSGILVPDEGRTAERWIDLLMRRQKRLPGPSRRLNP